MSHPEDPFSAAPNTGQTLRELAEEKYRLLEELSSGDVPGTAETKRLIHELRVHQIELEMQNEQLRESQKELEVSRDRFVDLYDFAPVGYCTISEKGLILEANLTVGKLLGVVRNVLLKQALTSFIMPKDQDIWYRHRQALSTTGEPQVCELRLLQTNNKPPIWTRLEATAAQDKVGSPTCRVVLSDITERKKAQKALQESEEKYRTVADFTYSMETWVTPDGMYRYVSPSCERITGHTAAEFLADPNLLIKITHPDDKSKLVEHFHLETNQGPIAQNMGIDFRILTPEGDIRWIGHSCTAVQGRDGRPLGRRESNRDITKRKRAEEEKEKLEEKNRRLQKAESLDRMAGAIAHHFNNKLQVVMGYLEIILSSLPQDDKYMNDLTSAMRAADEAAEVSRLMLIYLGQVTGTREPDDLSEICGRSLPRIQNTMPKNVALETDLLSPGPTIIANSKQIQLILTHLICNSWEATGNKRNTIQLSVKMAPSADIPSLNRFPVNWQPEDTSYACLEVRDTGWGIATEDIEKTFDPFFSTKFIGRGLGLPVILGLVQAHNGAITVESMPDQGSVFRVFFPRSGEDVPFQPDRVAKTSEIKGFGTVLLVDDDEIVLEITSVRLSMLGFEVLSARSGMEAVELFQQHKNVIRFVLTDFAMPRMNGLETLTALRQIVPGIPVILASGYSEEQVMDGSIHPERPHAFLAKPYAFQELKDAICRTLADKQE